MARSDAVQFFLELAAEWRRLGAEVTFEPGWERRGNGTSPAYEGGIVHHTAFLSSVAKPFPAHGTLLNGHPGLPGPLCNVAGPVCPAERPRLHIMAAFPANHAGASGGRSMGPLPTSSLFNRLVVGLEIDYAGFTPMIGGQYRAALIFAHGLVNVLRRSVEYVRAHAETSVTGKWDIGAGNGKSQTADMAAFRRDAANLSPLEDDVEQPQRDQLDELVRRVRSMHAGNYLPIGPEVPKSRPVPDWTHGGDLSWLDRKIGAAVEPLTAQLKALAAGRPPAVGQGSGEPVAVGDDQLARVIARPEVAAALGEAFAAAMDRRARDGDPATGPVS